MKFVQSYISAQAAIRIHQQVSRDVEIKQAKVQCGECNYSDNYYGDQVCLNKAQ